MSTDSKNTDVKYVAIWRGLQTLWGQSKTVAGAIDQVMQEARDCDLPEASKLGFIVYRLGARSELAWDDYGTRENGPDGVILGQAIPEAYVVQRIGDTAGETRVISDWRTAYVDGGKLMDARLAERTGAK